jgi:hypothetical protein
VDHALRHLISAFGCWLFDMPPKKQLSYAPLAPNRGESFFSTVEVSKMAKTHKQSAQ